MSRERDEAVSKRAGITRTTQRNAIAAAAVQLTLDGVDVEAVLKRLFEIGREQGRLQHQAEMLQTRQEASEARERATRYSQDLVRIRGVAHRLRADGVRLNEELVDAIYPKDVG